MTLGRTIVTAYAAGSSVLVIDSVTISEDGPAWVIDGETVSLAGTQLIIASSSTTTTTMEGLVGAILSGIGATGTSTPAAYTGAVAAGEKLTIYHIVSVVITAVMVIST